MPKANALLPGIVHGVVVQITTDAFNKLLHQGVIVRSLGVYKMPNHLRVSIGLPEENLLFLEKLKLTSS